MKVIMLPDYSQNNPYQRELVNALEKIGVHVTLCNFSILPLLRAIWLFGRPDILHLHWTDGFIVAANWPKTILKTFRFLIELFVVKILGVKVVWTVHNLSNHEKINSTYETFVNRFLIRFYDQVIVHCFAAQQAVAHLYHLTGDHKTKVRIVPHGHYLDCYENNITRQDARARLNYDEDAVLFLFFGSIRPYKGIYDLIEAFYKIKNPKVRLLIAGKPSSDVAKEELIARCQIDDRIKTYLQYIPENEIQIYMNAADVAVFPYTDILTSGSVLLAMSFGKPIIVPRIGCVSETLDAQGGFLYNAKDLTGLPKALGDVLSSDLELMGKHNSIKVKDFDWGKIAQMTRDVYVD
jgi:glycosyltransferase involved in cell wall biosynthesis